ncbi:uncharacterized protein [Trachinotus anak]|uniref:uncharacterized protein n=1 Tax=Trachinotus anak TaxID=443729 RepID=UPI0039F1B558
MTSLKTQRFLLTTVVLLLSVIPAVSEVVKSMSDCDQFLLKDTPPQVPGILEDGNILNQNRYKPICQTYNNTRRFVTLYDIKNKIPVFSANKYRGEKDRGRPRKRWRIEPQLENEHEDNMRNVVKGKIYNYQAGDVDYRNNRAFDRGHLFPSSYAFSKTDKIATFTLTNTVPQAHSFNQGSWRRMEICIKCVMDTYCINSNGVTEGFVVTGAQPSASSLSNRINIPSMLWSAFCCYSSNLKMWLASAHWGDNVPDESGNKHLQTKTLAELHNKLRTSNTEVKVFPESQCPLHTTVTEFYPDIQNCHCPSSLPTTSTSGYHSTTSTPLTSTSGPLRSSSAPPTSTSVPLTTASSSTTSGPITITSSTSGLPTSTSGLRNATSGPPTTISGPVSTTSVPTKSTSGSQSTSAGLPTSTTGLDVTTYYYPPTYISGLATTTSRHSTTTSGPAPSTSAPARSSSGPVTGH